MTVVDSQRDDYNSKPPALEALAACNCATVAPWLTARREQTDNLSSHKASAAARRRFVPMPEVIHKIQQLVGNHYGLTALDLRSARREPARTRQLAMWLCRHSTPYSLPAIGRAFGNRDHTTVAHAIRRVDERMAADRDFSRMVKDLLEEVA